jgi:hypothetical protein
MPTFRKKPVEIEAWQNPPRTANDGWSEVPLWVAQGASRITGGRWIIPTLEGEMMAEPGDWIIRGVKGELYPCKPDIFAVTYDPVSPSPAKEREDA